MGNKTIYVRDEDLWDKAKELAGDEGLSAFVSEALSAHVAARQRQAASKRKAKHMQEIVLSVEGPLHRETHDEVDHDIAFSGRLLYDTDVEAIPRCRVFQTKAGKLLLHKESDDGSTYELFDDFDQLSKSVDARNDFWLHDEFRSNRYEALAEIARELGRSLVIRID